MNRNNQSKYPKLNTKKLIVTEQTDLHKKVICHNDIEVRGTFKIHGIDSNNIEGCLRTTGTEVDTTKIWGLLKAGEGRYIFNPNEWNCDLDTGAERAYSTGDITVDPKEFSIKIGKESGLYEFTVNGTVRMGADLRVTITKNPGRDNETVLPEYHTFDESWQQMTLITSTNAVRDDVFVITFEVDCTTEVAIYSLIFKVRKI